MESGLLKPGSSASVTLVQSDAAISEDMRKMVLANEPDQPPVIGLVHAGGLLADATLLKQQASGVQAVFAPKASPGMIRNLHWMDDKAGHSRNGCRLNLLLPCSRIQGL